MMDFHKILPSNKRLTEGKERKLHFNQKYLHVFSNKTKTKIICNKAAHNAFVWIIFYEYVFSKPSILISNFNKICMVLCQTSIAHSFSLQYVYNVNKVFDLYLYQNMYFSTNLNAKANKFSFSRLYTKHHDINVN